MRQLYIFIFFSLFIINSDLIHGQCDNCIPDTNCSSPDGMPTFCPEELPPAITGEYYNTTASFSIPSSLTVDGITVDLISVSLASISGIPLGLEIQPNNANSTYYPSNGEEFGCVTVCGTPLVAGDYSINISVDVLATAFGFETSITENFSLGFVVIQGETSNASFSLSNLSGCAPLEVELINNISGPGTSYLWDLGGYGAGTELTLDLITDNFGSETTWNITDQNGIQVAEGGPYIDQQEQYFHTICVGNGCYTFNIYDSYGDGMQYDNVIGSYLLTDSEGNVIAENEQGANFGESAQHSFCIYNDTPSGCTPTSSNPTLIFEDSGEYEISLITTVTQLTLTSLDITTLSGGWSGDVEELFWGGPDTYINISGGDINYTSSWVDDTETPFFNNINLSLEYDQVYTVSFYDYDSVTDDDFLGSANFTASTLGEFMINGGGNTAIINITETTAAQFEDTETIIVYDSIDAYLDIDEDGYGDINFPVNGCDPSLQYSAVFNGEDCNDSDASIYPGAEGTWSGIDNDCNLIIEDDEVIAIEGCTEEGACNFDPSANVDDGSCEYNSCLGCTDPQAINFDPSALISDGLCEYADCFGDFNNDGSVTVADLLTLLSEFGCENDCQTDLSGDNIVSVADLLELLTVYGNLCE